MPGSGGGKKIRPRLIDMWGPGRSRSVFRRTPTSFCSNKQDSQSVRVPVDMVALADLLNAHIPAAYRQQQRLPLGSPFLHQSITMGWTYIPPRTAWPSWSSWGKAARLIGFEPVQAGGDLPRAGVDGGGGGDDLAQRLGRSAEAATWREILRLLGALKGR